MLRSSLQLWQSWSSTKVIIVGQLDQKDRPGTENIKYNNNKPHTQQTNPTEQKTVKKQPSVSWPAVESETRWNGMTKTQKAVKSQTKTKDSREGLRWCHKITTSSASYCSKKPTPRLSSTVQRIPKFEGFIAERVMDTSQSSAIWRPGSIMATASLCPGAPACLSSCKTQTTGWSLPYHWGVAHLHETFSFLSAPCFPYR